MTATETTWTASKDGRGLTTYHATLTDGRRVTIRSTGQRNGRVLGGAWIATTGWGADQVTVASAGTLRACKQYAEQAAAR